MNKQVVVVDDEQDILDMLRRAFTLEDIDCICFNDSVEALEFIKKNNNMIAVIDIKMPKMSGIQLLNEIKKYNPLCNIIIITGFSSMARVVECLGGGAIDYFVKPFSPMELMDKIDNILI